MINVTRSSMPDFDEYCDEIKDLWDSHILTNSGVKHQLLQKQLEKYLNIEHVVLFNNGHLALETIWDALCFPRGSEVITTPFTFCSTVHAFARKGLVPVFCDVDQKTYCIDPCKIEQLITKKTVAICAVHVYGNMCDVEAIDKIAKKHNLVVIYDAAHAFGVKYKGKSSASFGNMTMFSFHATKVYNTIEGGAVCLKNDDYFNKLNELKNFGIRDQESVVYIGGNAKMNEFQAAMGICNLRHLPEEIKKRSIVANRYREKLGNIEGILLCEPQQFVESNFAYFPVVFDGFRKNRDQVFDELKQHGIIARKYFYPLVSDMECYRKQLKRKQKDTPYASHLASRVLTLPIYADLTTDEVDLICNIILE